MTQTRDKLARDRVQGQAQAIQAHEQVGHEVREAIQRIGGTLPENIPPAEHIKEVRRTAATSPTLEEKLSWQKKQRYLGEKRGKLRRELFTRQDEVEAQRNDLISQLEVQLQQQVEERTLFTIEWELV
jgi:hypothetical protein